MSLMGSRHSEVVSFLSFLLNGYCQFKLLGKILLGPTIRFLPEVDREPDICYYSGATLPLSDEIPRLSFASLGMTVSKVISTEATEGSEVEKSILTIFSCYLFSLFTYRFLDSASLRSE